MKSEKVIGKYVLEICSSSPTSAIAAQEGGACRIEFCQNLESGGLTPTHAQIELARKNLAIGIFVLIRPRSGNFIYSNLEIEEMIHDIQFCKEMGCDGVVIGALDENGKVNHPQMRELIAAAGAMPVVFHRAFDLCSNPFEALEAIIDLGCTRILTSGLAQTAWEGRDLIRQLIEKAAGRIEIMPGSGVDEKNIQEILDYTRATSIHSSAKEVHVSTAKHKNFAIQGMDEPQTFTSVNRVKSLVRILEEKSAH
ncbi:copper homeostasis protein CutC [Sphingobacterium sp. lm-10]|uniref:copper homeostasis protein CutC n=1 Tax=Sphingobacterium sp. lm-10 TaxID=2944904 RepID=UPI002020DEF4|nr:copper homeostasis protein CutC [Sphingobacterium sp. lm-10]MCL7986479.1 copper homeostasis protein CutC [Sphingobacterium sp. lm-10]